MFNTEYELICYGKTVEPRYGLYKLAKGERTLVKTGNDEVDLINLPKYNEGKTIINLINCTFGGMGQSVIYR